ncbi:MAG TPA: hypothetical protein VJ225_03765, partial [Nitrososphaeraceae archaeon]|nr:hypothetical protein [Nitrososphaeraceae archaeon]
MFSRILCTWSRLERVHQELPGEKARNAQELAVGWQRSTHRKEEKQRQQEQNHPKQPGELELIREQRRLAL